MKHIYKSFFKYFLAVLTVVSFSSCNNDDDLYPSLGNEIKSISDILDETAEISALKGALEQAGLYATLKDNTTFTLFAPTNTAFGGADLSGLSDDELENLLLNHVWNTSTADFSKNLQTGYRNTMAAGYDGNNLSFFVNTSDPITFNGGVSPVSGMFDKGAINGVVHVVDGVIDLPTVVDLIAPNPEYSSLAAALANADLVDTLKGDGPFTIFAPDNAAFDVLMTQLNDIFGWATIEDIPSEVLTAVLQYHVIEGINTISDEVSGKTFNSMQGEPFLVTGTTIDDASYTNGEINLLDVQGTNGIAHGTDKVLLPDAVFQQVLSATLPLNERLADKGYSSFLAAAELAGLTDMLTQDQLTAFVPNNAAFDVLFLIIENFDSLSDFDTPEEIDALRALLEYHLTAGITMSNQLSNTALTTVQGEDITVDISNGVSLTPTRENAPAAIVGMADIGASNGVIHEIDNVLIPEGLAEALGYPEPITDGQPVYGFEIYDDALREGMWVGGWTAPDFSNTDPVKSGVYSIGVTFPNGDEGWQVGGASLNVQDYSFVNASIYSETGTTVGFVLNEQWGSTFNVEIPAGEWTEVAVPISSVANGTTTFTQLVIRGAAGTPGDTIYIDEVGFDVTFVSSVPSLAVEVYTDALADGMWVGGWTTPDFLNTDPVREGIYSSAVTFPNGDEGWQVGGLALNVQDYDFVNASIYSELGTTVGFVLNEQWGSTYNVEIPAGEWLDIAVPISQVANGTEAFSQLVIRGTGVRTNDTVFIDNVGFN
ncbi:fasciclin domain-containing protein [uncultured Algibacter sp.]|uniref:fasciclin domain-containing protein n=1 Tax=uncultured Algibacter sp. TaxID=298659 RepID=UPI00261E8FF1|nr:fasciclin domain-containing protein [uncultured Algibacter sp.]